MASVAPLAMALAPVAINAIAGGLKGLFSGGNYQPSTPTAASKVTSSFLHALSSAGSDPSRIYTMQVSLPLVQIDEETLRELTASELLAPLDDDMDIVWSTSDLSIPKVKAYLSAIMCLIDLRNQPPATRKLLATVLPGCAHTLPPPPPRQSSNPVKSPYTNKSKATNKSKKMKKTKKPLMRVSKLPTIAW